MDKEKVQFRWMLAGGWVIALVAAFTLDRPVAEWVHRNVPVDKNRHVTHLILEFIKLPGYFPVTLTIAFFLGLFHRRHWIAASILAGNGVVVGALYSVIKWITGRHRPDHGIAPMDFHPFAQGLSGLWREKALCFPSGHASLSFATAATLAVLLPRWKALFFAIACAVAAERVLENAHYLSDVVAGAGMGTIVGWALTALVASPQMRQGFEVIPAGDQAPCL